MAVILIKKLNNGILEGNSWGEEEIKQFNLEDYEFVIKLEGGMYVKDFSVIDGKVELVEGFIEGLNLVAKVYKY